MTDQSTVELTLPRRDVDRLRPHSKELKSALVGRRLHLGDGVLFDDVLLQVTDLESDGTVVEPVTRVKMHLTPGPIRLRCSSCGDEARTGDRECATCGSELAVIDLSATAARPEPTEVTTPPTGPPRHRPPAATAPPTMPPATPEPTPGRSARSTWLKIAAIVAIALIVVRVLAGLASNSGSSSETVYTIPLEDILEQINSDEAEDAEEAESAAESSAPSEEAESTAESSAPSEKADATAIEQPETNGEEAPASAEPGDAAVDNDAAEADDAPSPTLSRSAIEDQLLGTRLNGMEVVGVASAVSTDLDGDGVDEWAAVVLTYGGGSGIFFELLAIEGSNPDEIEVGNAHYLGDRIEIVNVDASENVVTVTLLDRRPDEPFAATPTVETVVQASFVGGSWVVDDAGADGASDAPDATDAEEYSAVIESMVAHVNASDIDAISANLTEDTIYEWVGHWTTEGRGFVEYEYWEWMIYLSYLPDGRDLGDYRLLEVHRVEEDWIYFQIEQPDFDGPLVFEMAVRFEGRLIAEWHQAVCDESASAQYIGSWCNTLEPAASE